MTLHRVSRYTMALALLALPAVAGAQGFGLNEIGSCALARGYAATAMPCDDASSIYWNPGALQRARGWSVYAGAAAIQINGDFIQDTTFRTYEGDVPTAEILCAASEADLWAAARGLGPHHLRSLFQSLT